MAFPPRPYTVSVGNATSPPFFKISPASRIAALSICSLSILIIFDFMFYFPLSFPIFEICFHAFGNGCGDLLLILLLLEKFCLLRIAQEAALHDRQRGVRLLQEIICGIALCLPVIFGV